MEKPQTESAPRTPRRAFLADAWRWAGLGLAAGGLVVLQRTLAGAAPGAETVSLDAGQLGRLDQKGRLIIPGYYVFGSSEAPRALRMRCTHLGCALAYDARARRFDCPCHGSRFDEQGQVLAGPAKEALAEVAVSRSRK